MSARSLFKILLAILALRGTCQGQECDPNGVSCVNCTDYQECNGGAPKGPILSCKNGAKCGNQTLLEHCWTKLNCYALNECTEAGIFPDVMTESNYFVCLPDSSSGFLKYEFTCPEGEFFDKTARMCVASAATSETLETTVTVSTPAPTPETTTTTPASDTTTSATTLAPTAETTTPATTTIGSTSESTITTPTSDTTTSTPTPTPTTETTTLASTPETTITTSVPTSTPTTIVPTPEPTTPLSPFVCPAPGIFPNPTNCKMYFRCSTSLKVFYYICPGTSYFNENILKCSLIITPACREQILQNTSTSATPMTTASTFTTTPVRTTLPTTTTAPESTVIITTLSSIQPPTITTTQAPKTTTTTSTQPSTIATTEAPSTPFSCSAAGTFENPFDCKTYYRCSSSGKTFLYVCPNGSYYNEFTKRCGLTITPRCRSKLEN